MKIEARHHVKPRTQQWAQCISQYECVYIFICCQNDKPLSDVLTYTQALTGAARQPMCTHTYKYTLVPTASQIVTDRWVTLDSPVNHGKAVFIAVTLVFWCLFIHLKTHVTILRAMKEELNVQPHTDCLSPPLPRAILTSFRFAIF